MEAPIKVDCYCPSDSCIEIVKEKICSTCVDNPCVYVCPAGLLTAKAGKIVINRDAVCLECGACRLVCDNIRFDYPPGGRGIVYRIG